MSPEITPPAPLPVHLLELATDVVWTATLDGRYLASEIPNLKVMFMSGYVQDMGIKSELLIQKPFTIQVLLTRVKIALS